VSKGVSAATCRAAAHPHCAAGATLHLPHVAFHLHHTALATNAERRHGPGPRHPASDVTTTS